MQDFAILIMPYGEIMGGYETREKAEKTANLINQLLEIVKK
jgi:hypothetical protein